METDKESTDNPAEITEKIKEIIRKNGIRDIISEVVVKDTGPEGVGFTCSTLFVTVKFQNSENVKPVNLFVKVRKQNFSHTEMLGEMRAFENEATFYVDYVSAAEEMCKSKGREGFIDFYPKCYYGDANLIVLENLLVEEKGYLILDEKAREDIQVAIVAITTLAKHHAVAHVMMKENDGSKNFFEKFPNLDYECYDYDKPNIVATMEPLFDTDINSHAIILERSKLPGADNVAAKLKSFPGKPMSIIIDTLKKKDEDSLLILCHGDYRNNNMLFLRDKETNKIVHHIVIDLQLTRYNSPAIDLGYFLFTSASPSLRENHLNELLELYKDTFNGVTKDFGHPANLSFEKLFLEFRKKIAFAFWMGLTVAVGPGMAEFMNVGNISEVDVKESVGFSYDLVHKWIDNNPEKAAKVAEELVKVVQQYEKLKLLNDGVNKLYNM